MERRPLGRTGIDVSVCCLGTMTWGEQNTAEEGFAQMDRALEAGVDFFDTAELYAIPPRPETAGRTEEIIGDWFAARKNRDAVILATKVVGRAPGMTWFRKDGSGARVTPAQISEAVEGSLKRLKTDYIDLYQIHWPDRGVEGFGHFAYRDYDEDYVSFEDQLETLARHVDKGDIRHLGLSNETAWGVSRFLAVAEARGWPRMASIQNAYSLLNRTFETNLAEVALREDVGLLAYSPLAQGVLTGKYLDGATPPGSRKALFKRMQRYETPGAEPAIRAYVRIAQEAGLDPAALALAFVASRPFCTSAIIGATTMPQLETALSAFTVGWNPDLEDAVQAVHRACPNPCP